MQMSAWQRAQIGLFSLAVGTVRKILFVHTPGYLGCADPHVPKNLLMNTLCFSIIKQTNIFPASEILSLTGRYITAAGPSRYQKKAASAPDGSIGGKTRQFPQWDQEGKAEKCVRLKISRTEETGDS